MRDRTVSSGDSSVAEKPGRRRGGGWKKPVVEEEGFIFVFEDK